MAGKAGLIKDVLGNTLRADKDFNSELSGQYQAFKENLIHDISSRTLPIFTLRPSLTASSRPPARPDAAQL